MKEIIAYINDNAIVASLIVFILTTIVQIIFRCIDKKHSDDKEYREVRRHQLENKAELHIEEKQWDSKEEPDICLFMSDFETKINDRGDVDFYYRKDVLKKDKYQHLRFYIKNIGKSDINELTICATNKQHVMICGVDSVKYLVDDKYVDYCYLYDRKIMKGETILIDIAYLKESKICNMFSCELALIFKDSYNNLYEQPFFIQQRNLYEPNPINYKKYREYINSDIAIECFKKPWMW